jgi:hypothetical protein
MYLIDLQLSLRGMKRTFQRPKAKKPARYSDLEVSKPVPDTQPLFKPEFPPEYVEMRRNIFGKDPSANTDTP